MAYGTPANAADVEAFYTDIRRGHPPTVEQLADLQRRYAAIGGISPLAERTTAQISVIQKALDVIVPTHFSVAFGAKHSRPRIEETVDALADNGVSAIVGVVLAPHYSEMSVGEYIARARERAGRRRLKSGFVERWGSHPVLIDVLAERVLKEIDALGRTPAAVEVIFTAHSLPVRILESGDSYPAELAETAALVADKAGLARWRVAWQSAGRTDDAWLGPDILDELERLAGEGATAVVVCPAGFTSDHLEVCYDLDIEAAHRAKQLGVAFARTASLNDEPRIAAAIAELVASVDPSPAK